MPLELDPNLDKDRAKTIKLDGKDFYIAPLPLRQVLAMAALLPKLKHLQEKPPAEAAELFSQESIDPVLDMLVVGLKKAYPTVTRDDLLDMPIGIDEMVAAIPVVISQAGGKPAEAQTEGVTGEV